MGHSTTLSIRPVIPNALLFFCGGGSPYIIFSQICLNIHVSELTFKYKCCCPAQVIRGKNDAFEHDTRPLQLYKWLIFRECKKKGDYCWLFLHIVIPLGHHSNSNSNLNGMVFWHFGSGIMVILYIEFISSYLFEVWSPVRIFFANLRGQKQSLIVLP